MSQVKLPDGVTMPMQNPHNPYNRFGAYAPNETDPYSVQANYNYPASSKPYEKSEEGSNYSFSSPFTPPQYSPQVAEPPYSHPYYSGSGNSNTTVTDSQNTQFNNPNQGPMNQYNVNVYNDPYAHQMGNSPNVNQMSSIPEAVPSVAYSQSYVNQDLNVNFSQMQVGPKNEPKAGAEYSQMYYSIHYPNVSTPNMATYSNAPQNSNTTMVASQLPSDYSSLNYPYSSDAQNPYQAPVSTYNMPQVSNFDPNPVSNAYSMPDPQFNYGSNYEAVSQGFTVYTNADSTMTSTTSVVNVPNVTPASTGPYGYPSETDPNYVSPAALAQLDAMDKPIKSHVTGEALTYSFDQTTMNFQNLNEQNTSNQYPSSTQNYTANYAFVEHPAVSYGQTYQNHPGYTYNGSTGSYDYNYGSQNSFTNYSNTGQVSVDPQSIPQEQNWSAHGVYTSAGACETVHSPSETPQMISQGDGTNNQYYNAPYGYSTNTNQSNEVAPDPVTDIPASTNYGANLNQSTYMQSGLRDTSVTYTSNQGKTS